ncbi:hypothetical protein ACFLXP_03465, partial [Chloroflexota bacterium]
GLTVDDLYSIYNKDAAAADAEFKRQTLTVTGVVDKVTVNDVHEIFYIILAGAEKKERWNVRCTFARQYASNLKQLANGQRVAVQGAYDGYKLNILMKNCEILS